MQDIPSLRKELKTLSEEFFLFLEQRRSLVSSIQATKDNSKQYFCFDPKYEATLFTKQSESLSKLSLKELYAYSLILEDHANVSNGSYPEWSIQPHLDEKNHEQMSGINPILLAVTHKDLYDQLLINDEFKSILGKYVS